eukprot:179117-Pelagomonas_calceolata.AAC.2
MQVINFSALRKHCSVLARQNTHNEYQELKSSWYSKVPAVNPGAHLTYTGMQIHKHIYTPLLGPDRTRPVQRSNLNPLFYVML